MLVVAKLRLEMFDAQGVLGSWDQALLMLGRHKKFGKSAARCVAVLEILSNKVFQDVSGKGTATAGGPQVGEGMGAQEDQFMGNAAPEMDFGGLDFDVSDFQAFNTDFWGMLDTA